MTIIGLVIFIVIVGFILWVINVAIPMAGSIKGLLNLLVFILLVIIILQFFGIIPHIIPMPTQFKY